MIEIQRASHTEPQEEGIDLRELVRMLWMGKWLIGGVAFAATAIAIIVSLMLPNIYRAEALLAPNDQQNAGGLSALAAQYGSLASLAGINIADGKTDKTTLGLEVLKSRKFISEFIDRHDILVPLIAAQGWDAETGALEIDPDDYDVAAKKWVRDVRPPKTTTPSLQEAYDDFMDVLTVVQDSKSGFVRIAVDYYSPTIAKQWVDWLIEDLNASIMHQDVREAELAIEYLNKQIESTSLAELQSVFFGLIEEKTKTVMLAKVSDEYLLKTLDPAVAPEMKSRPKRSLIVMLSALLGSFLGFAVVLISMAWRRKNTG